MKHFYSVEVKFLLLNEEQTRPVYFVSEQHALEKAEQLMKEQDYLDNYVYDYTTDKSGEVIEHEWAGEDYGIYVRRVQFEDQVVEPITDLMEIGNV